MLTETTLRQLANASTYSRGEDYFYNNQVERIKRAGNTFTSQRVRTLRRNADPCRQAGQLANYVKLRTYWPDSQRRTFADSLLPKANPAYMPHPLFYAQVLHAKDRTDDLFVWLKSLDWLQVRGLPDILTLTARTHPTDCLTLAQNRATTYLETGKRDRTLYSIIASWLFALMAVPTLKGKVMLLATQLVARFPTLRALKDEFRMKGLV